MSEMINELFENDNAILKASLVNIGSLGAIKSAIEKARAGKPVTLGFLGGSITAGSGSKDGMHYVRHTTDFWRETFPESEITCVNAGIGATGSILGVFRMDKDVLAAKPDVLVIDHSVNDNGDEARTPGSTKQTYECVLRKALSSGAAVVPLCICSSDGNSRRDMNLELARHYDLPFISVKDSIYDLMISSGKHGWTEYSGDSVHPNNVGHRMLAELLINYFKIAMADVREESKGGNALPAPLFGDSYMNTEMLDGGSLTPVSYGAFKVADTNFYQFKGGWLAEDSGEPIVFELKDCRAVHIAFLRDTSESAGKAEVAVCGVTAEFDAAFKNGWGLYAETKRVFVSDSPKDITLSIRPSAEGKRFALLRIMVAR